jgi:23S rRNA G2445 N2-methylase RlmL
MDRGAGDLVARLGDPGFTPSVRTLGALLDLVCGGDEDRAKAGERGVLRIEAQYATRVAAEVVRRARAEARPGRARATLIAGRLAALGRDPEGVALAWMLEALEDADTKTRRAAARGLGNVTPKQAKIETALAQAFDRVRSDADRSALALALGKMGGEAARARLGGTKHVRAAVIAERDAARGAPASIDAARSLPSAVRVRFHTRSGLEEIVREELGDDFGAARLVAPGIVEATLEGPLTRALAVRTATHVGIALEPPSRASDDRAAAIVTALTSQGALAIFQGLTETKGSAPIRFRLEVKPGGHQRALVWRCAELLRERTKALVNDPKDSTWEVVVRGTAQLDIELVPRAYVDERFAYREDLVAASSHPTIAAALARVAPRRDDDVVWDPFAGAGAELVERARVGPYARLVGTDVDARAVAGARRNLARAGLDRATVEEADATEYAPAGVTAIITNPPMGRRVERGSHADLLERFVVHAAKLLAPGGSITWLVPEPKRIRPVAERAGLRFSRGITVDMGGFPAELSVYVKGERTSRKR